MNAQNISGVVGHALDLDLTVTLDGTAKDITADTLVAYLKTGPSQADANALETLTVGSGIVVTDGANGVARIIFSATVLAHEPGTYFYHVTLTTGAALYSIAHGKLVLRQI